MTSNYIYRILHFSNLNYILQHGIVTSPNHPNANPNYRSIGNNDIINIRSNKIVPTHDVNTFKDYIAFYFGKRSIMLLNIISGYGEIKQVNQDEIVYIIYDISKIEEHGYDFFFTDGHALKAPVTQFFTNLNQLDKIDFSAVNATNFSAEAQNNHPDLKRKKQAEFHIHNEMDFSNIHEIIVFNKKRQEQIQSIVIEMGYNTTVKVDSSFYFM